MSALYMLDTDISSYVIKSASASVEDRLLTLNVSQVCISAITRAELLFGVRRLEKAVRLAAKVETFLSGVRTLPWDEEAANQFADVRARLEKIGSPIGTMDTMIAAHAKALHAILVTNNKKHFQMVRGLVIENWAT